MLETLHRIEQRLERLEENLTPPENMIETVCKTVETHLTILDRIHDLLRLICNDKGLVE
jgi:uncharacterized coiled-coil protein SlyX